MREKANTYFLYARKSSETEDRQLASVDSQISELKALAVKRGLRVVDTLPESQSAKMPGRPVFESMLARIKNGEADGILCWKLNRLSRNPVDSGNLQWLLQGNIIKNIVTTDRDYWPEDNSLLMGVEMSMANQFIRDLSVDTKRGLRTKAERGWFPGFAPCGYKANPLKIKGDKEILIDEQRFALIQRAFKGIAAGKYTPMQAYNIATNEWGLTNRNGSAIARSTWYAMMNNTFYYGEFEYPKKSGTWYQGKHKPLLEKREFQKIQLMLGEKGTTRPSKYDFLYRGSMRCGNCGALITAENKVKSNKKGDIHTYIYYHCTYQKDPTCKERGVEEKVLETQFQNLMKDIEIPQGFKDWAVQYFKEKYSESVEGNQKIRENQKRILDSLEDKIDRLLELRLSGEISEELFFRKKEALLTQKVKLEEVLSSRLEDETSWIENLERTLSLAEDIRNRFKKGNEDTKKFILNTLGSNLFLKSKQIAIETKNPIFILKKLSPQAKAIFQRFEPLKTALDKEKLEFAYSSCPVMLRR